jgi:hypothetical protein
MNSDDRLHVVLGASGGLGSAVVRASRGPLFGLEGDETLRGASRQANVLFGNEGNIQPVKAHPILE